MKKKSIEKPIFIDLLLKNPANNITKTTLLRSIMGSILKRKLEKNHCYLSIILRQAKKSQRKTQNVAIVEAHDATKRRKRTNFTGALLMPPSDFDVDVDPDPAIAQPLYILTFFTINSCSHCRHVNFVRPCLYKVGLSHETKIIFYNSDLIVYIFLKKI